MKIRKLIFSFLALSVLMPNSLNSVKAEDSIINEDLVTIADTHVSAGDNADLNYGRSGNVNLRSRATIDKNYYEFYLKFSVTAGVKKVDSANLALTYHTVNGDVVGRHLTIYTTDTTWNEGSGNVNGEENATVENKLTYNTASTLAATHTDNYQGFEITGEEPVRGDVLTIDVKSIVNEYLKLNSNGTDATEISFRVVSDSGNNEKELLFRAKENTNGGAPVLSLTYDLNNQEDAVDVKSEINKLDTMAMLDFKYSYSGTSENYSSSIAIDTSISTYPKENEDFSTLLGLNSELFTVTANKNGATNTPRVYNGYIRMYVNNSITINALGFNISSISFEISGSTLTVLNASGNEIEQLDGKYIINDSTFTLKNASSAAFNITNLTINYSVSSVKYTSFSNVCMKFKATIPNTYLENATAFGIKVRINEKEKDVTITEFKEEDNSKSFALVISNITDYNVEITGRAYVIINGEIVYLNSKTYSVNSMITEYLAQSSELELTLDQVQALEGFNKFINEN